MGTKVTAQVHERCLAALLCHMALGVTGPGNASGYLVYSEIQGFKVSRITECSSIGLTAS